MRSAGIERHPVRLETRARISAFVRLCQLLAAPGGGWLGFQNSRGGKRIGLMLETSDKNVDEKLPVPRSLTIEGCQ